MAALSCHSYDATQYGSRGSGQSECIEVYPKRKKILSTKCIPPIEDQSARKGCCPPKPRKDCKHPLLCIHPHAVLYPIRTPHTPEVAIGVPFLATMPIESEIQLTNIIVSASLRNDNIPHQTARLSQSLMISQNLKRPFCTGALQAETVARR